MQFTDLLAETASLPAKLRKYGNVEARQLLRSDKWKE